MSSARKLSALGGRHLGKIKAHYDQVPPLTPGARSYRRILAHYYNLLIPPSASVLEIGCGRGDLLVHLNTRRVTGVDLSAVQIEEARQRLPWGRFVVQAGEELELPGETFDYIILSDTLNLVADVQLLFERLHACARADTRLLLNFQSALWRPALWLTSRLGLRTPPPENSWLASSDVKALLALTDWEAVKFQSRILSPIRLAGLGPLVNRYFSPLFSWLCLSVFCIARPARSDPRPPASVSVIIPARNEAGNIEGAIRRTPAMGVWTELILVEGHSTDGTWQEIQRVQAACGDQRRIKTLQQSGEGKGNAVREGFAAAEGDILMILDADLTVPPEELPKFYLAVTAGRCDLANGCRLIYPIEGRAMRFLNLCANKTFSLLFTWLLRQPIKDTLCGTKALTRANYLRIADQRQYFGEFDPFGDFDLLFGADKLNLKIADIPIRYQDRTYGQTNIQRWRHGWLLLRMVVFAARKLRFI
ncbi:MAG TPA: glycosyltransferase [Opitutaceae bacterium]|nr:glycosyltransferase [Opitutaceae bacterium]